MLNISDTLKENINKDSQSKELNIRFDGVKQKSEYETSDINLIICKNISGYISDTRFPDEDYSYKFSKVSARQITESDLSLLPSVFSHRIVYSDNSGSTSTEKIRYYYLDENILNLSTDYKYVNKFISQDPNNRLQIGFFINLRQDCIDNFDAFVPDDMQFQYDCRYRWKETFIPTTTGDWKFGISGISGKQFKLQYKDNCKFMKDNYGLDNFGIVCFITVDVSKYEDFILRNMSFSPTKLGGSYSVGDTYPAVYSNVHHAFMRVVNKNETSIESVLNWIGQKYQKYFPIQGISIDDALYGIKTKINKPYLPTNINFYCGDVQGNTITMNNSIYFNATINSKSRYSFNLYASATTAYKSSAYFINIEAYKYRYMCISFEITSGEGAITSNVELMLSLFGYSKSLTGIDGEAGIYKDSYNFYNSNDIVGKTNLRIYFIIDISDLQRISGVSIKNNSNISASVSAFFNNMCIEVSDDIGTFSKQMQPIITTSPYDDITQFYQYPMVDIEKIDNNDLVAEAFSMTESLCSDDNIKFGVCESAHCEFTCVDRNEPEKDLQVAPQLIIENEILPLGVYNITEVKKEYAGDFVKRTITGYDNSIKLDVNAYNWYTQYMYAVTTTTYQPRYGVEFARQIYSTYFNLAKTLGLEKRDKSLELIKFSEDYAKLESTYSYTSMLSLSSVKSTNIFIAYCRIVLDNIDPEKLYVVDSPVRYNSAPSFYFQSQGTLGSYLDNIDSLGRGVFDSGICVTETVNNEGVISTNSFLVNSGDYFMVNPNATKLEVFVPAFTYNSSDKTIRSSFGLVDSVTISEVNKHIGLTNGWIRLMYYNWYTKEIFAAESSITARDIVRSLLEVTGCFFNIDRYGNTEFKYCTKSALYPSETLYPRDDLYPRGLDGDTLPTGRYISFEAGDYIVRNYGKIQIVKNTNSSDTKSTVEWEYIGNSEATNTYLIDNNIFYCSEGMEYEYDSMPEVSDMLKNMYAKINNMGYTPNVTKAPGLPHLEVGDRIGLLTKSDGIESFIFRRTLTGIQALKDTFESAGDEYTEAVNDYGYSEWKG